MTLVYHKIQHADGLEAGASVDCFLDEGLKSKALLRKEGKLEKKETIYERALTNRARWIEERKVALADNPQLLQAVLSSDTENTWIRGAERFFKPKFKGNREENVFFGYHKAPPDDDDWVAIDASDDETIHNASFRDEENPEKWERTSVKLGDFVTLTDKPSLWRDHYNEILRYDQVSPDEIVAYAKIEKTLPIDEKLAANDIKNIKALLGEKLKPYVQFEKAEDNILLHQHNSKLDIRVAFNKQKASSNEAQQRIRAVFSGINSIEPLIEKKEETFHRPLVHSPILGIRSLIQ